MKTKKEVSFYLIFLGWIAYTSLVGLSLLTLNQYSPLLTLIISSSYLLVFYFIKPIVNLRKFDWLLFTVILVSLLFRASPNIYLEGGQDQGVYIAMSKQYEVNRGLYIKDSLKQRLTPEGKDLYEESGEGFVIALRESSDSSSDYEFPFYPVHPLWLSISGFIFGDLNRVYSLTVFSILSIIGTYLLARELGRNRWAGFIAALLLAVNPLHVFFSNFPVTEVVLLAFTTNAFYLLLYYYNTSKTPNFIYLALSALLFTVSFFTRMTSLLYMPIFFLIYVAVLNYKDLLFKRHINRYLLYVYIGWVASYLFYIFKLPNLFLAFFGEFQSIYGNSGWQLIPITMLGLVVSSLWIVGENRRISSVLFKIGEYLYLKSHVIVLLLITVSILYSGYQLYLMGFTDNYIGTRYDTFWYMAEKGVVVFKDLAITSIILYLTPVGFFLYIYYLLSRKYQHSFPLQLLNAFTLIFLLHSVFILRFTPHHYYFARYQLSELIPYGLIAVSLVVVGLLNSSKGWKILASLAFIAIFVYSLYFSLYQLGKYQGADPVFFQEMQSIVSNDDTIIYYDRLSWSDSFLLTPLRYFYNYNVISVDRLLPYASLTGAVKEGRVFLASTTQIPDLNNRFSGRILYTQNFMAATKEPMDFPLEYSVTRQNLPLCERYIPEKFCGGLIPLQYHEGKINIYLYQLR